MKSSVSNGFGESYKTSQFFTLILVGVFAVLAGLIVALFGSAEWISNQDPIGPIPGVVKSHSEKSKSVPTGQRSDRKTVAVIEVEISYSFGGQDLVFTEDRSPKLADSHFAIGQAVDVYRIGERATLTPENDLVFGPTLTFIGFGVFAFGVVIVAVGGISVRKRLRTKP